MDGGERERAERSRIKQGVKRNRRQKRLRAQQLRSATSQTASQSAVVEESSTVGDRNRDALQVTENGPDTGEDSTTTISHHLGSSLSISAHDADAPFYNEDDNLQGTVITPSCQGGHALSPGSPAHYRSPNSATPFPPLRILHHREAELLMHYLDHVFHLQFRFHSPSVRTGGRGWLLWLLIRTGPLYHAALSLSALHQHVILHRKENADHSETSDHFSTTFHELNEYHGRTLQELQVCLQTSQTDTGHPDVGRQIEILACGVQLISFQVSTSLSLSIDSR